MVSMFALFILNVAIFKINSVNEAWYSKLHQLLVFESTETLIGMKLKKNQLLYITFNKIQLKTDSVENNIIKLKILSTKIFRIS
ncbi:hypothetical protein BpHYR1_036890 [Brachionus plicatilis]|uniref:Uncharacterized protein n=1 Tax=Brachionus plicatilis TaxID=10195 RepID=A0A3M7QTJ2_BRAPC|nr:hypothetical protein BpHYR1_036890 [Brachionus plicatilis]